MNYIRNSFCLLMIAFIAALIYLNSEDCRQRAKAWIQQEVKSSTGYEVSIEDIEFDFPRSVLLTNVSTAIEGYGPISAEKVKLTASLSKLLFGQLTDGTVYLEGVKTQISSPIPIPRNLRIHLSWNLELTEFEGKLDLLESGYGKFPYFLLGPSKFKITLPKAGESGFPSFTSSFSKLQVKDYLLESFTLDGGWDLKNNSGHVSLFSKEVLGSDFSLSNLSVDLSNRNGLLNQLVYDLSTEGIYKDSFSADLLGSIFLESTTLSSIQLDRCNLTIGEHSIALKKPLKATLHENTTLVIPSGDLTIDGRELLIAGNSTKEAIDIKLTLPKQPFSYDIPKEEISPLTGNIGATVFLHGPFSDLRGGMELHLDSMVVKHPSLDKKLIFQMDLSGSLLEDGIALTGTLFDHDFKLLDIDGRLPVDRQGSFPLMIPRDKQLAVHFSGKLDAARYIHNLISANLWLTGKTTFALDLEGSIDNPSLNGNIQFREGTFERWESGTLLKNIHADFAVTQDKILLKSLQAVAGPNGKVTALGELNLIAEQNFPFHVDLNLEHSTLVDLDHVEIALSGKGTFTGDTKGSLLKGELYADLLDITLRDESSSIKHNIEVNYVNQSRHEKAPTQIVKTDVSWPICYDLHVKNRKNVSIHGKELKSEWKGDIKVAGCDDQPLLSGELRVINGDYLFNGKKFKISEGTISFSGELNKQTTLYVVGEMEIDHIVAQVVLKGSLDDPSLLFRSNPPLSQREILSWILFGRGMSEITPFQGAELTQSISKLKGAGEGGPSLLTRFKDSLGIDRIRFSGDGDSEDLSLQVGKYITPGLFLGVKRSMATEVNRIGIEANLMKNVKIQAEVGDDTEGQLHLKWKHDY